MQKTITTLTLGDTTLDIAQYYQSGAPVHLIRLHGDEHDAKQCGLWWVEENGGHFIDLDHEQREHHFALGDRFMSFDPNRIFTREGIIREVGPDPVAIQCVQQIADHIRHCLKPATCVIALHNNEDFSIHDYLPGGEYVNSAAVIHYNPDQHPHNLILTTQCADFDFIQSHNINAVLLNASEPDHPGSLSDHCHQSGIRYFNIETHHGQLEEQKKLLALLLSDPT